MDTKNVPLIKTKRFWAGILLAQFILFYIFSKSEYWISFFDKLYDVQKNFHIRIFSWIPFSAGDLFYILIGIFLLVQIMNIFRKNRRKKALFRILIFLNIIYFTYQIFWGMMYFQNPIIKKLASQDKPNVEKAKLLALKYLKKAGETRKSASEDKNGVFVIKNREGLVQEIIRRQSFLPNQIISKNTLTKISVKESLFSNIMSYTGISGYYNPFTAESQFNSNLPHSIIPFTIAHETSHQLGFAREQEANFVAYLTGINSDNPELRYSAEYFTLKSLLRYIYTEDKIFAENLIRQYSPAMKRDRAYERNFMISHEGRLEDFFGFTNDLFLKSNRQEGSVTYSYFVNLLLNYEK
ncbi:DUF3810 domain-containing protein [Chryseobacterium caseinilyticum]|uniref:DUF3810 domain-containing protein n=1 Tax=Chryseobacterium caseinilyticum TaxID=2771428 RepID=A0ABR8ZDI3_9FLAO|nr:DUF3810 domain-containing protein [Chryseobacterium caseinilyticum]MBD8083331.1 DUF3810 domain-containing protein [Chryseobacterium caseinilyticum]